MRRGTLRRPARPVGLTLVRAVHWFRNDLRLRDNRALADAASRADSLVLLFVLDERLLASPRSGAPRLHFFFDCLQRLAATLEERGQHLCVRRGDPLEVLPRFVDEAGAELLTFNRIQTPYARRRDAEIRSRVERAGAQVRSHKDHVVFESGDVLSQQGRPYAVFTPYKKAWYRKFQEEEAEPRRAPRLPPPVSDLASEALPEPPAPGEGIESLPTGGAAAAQRRLDTFLSGAVARYAQDRDLPALDGTSRLSPYLRFGAISIRDCIARAREAAAAERSLAQGVEKWVDELVWREFYAAILEEHPRVAHSSYRREFEAVGWNSDEAGFRAWCEGRTGYPIVDAGMRQLASTGWMHNRLRMITASFLSKDLLIDWRRGEEWFFQNLVDADPASNNGGWQWAASTGTDAAPYFRIFNPVAQGRRFDPEGDYVRRFVPELAHLPADLIHEPWKSGALLRDYPPPVVDHAERRAEALARYQEALEATR